MLLSQEAYRKIDRELAKFPADQKQSAVMAALAIAQVEKGWLSPEVMQDIADYLGMPAIAVQEVATFYTMYNLKPVGKHKLTICTNLARPKSWPRPALSCSRCRTWTASTMCR